MQHLKERKMVLDTAQEIYREKMVPGTWGNVSMRVKDEPLFLVTPSGMAYETMTIDDIVLLDLAGNVVEGERVPSTELHLHVRIYRRRSDVGGIVHVHTVFASAFAVAGKTIPVVLEETAQVIGHPVAVAPYAPCGTEELAEQTAQTLDAGSAVLLANHGLVGVGPDLTRALTVCRVAEKTAQVSLLATLLGQVNPLGAEEIDILRKQFAVYGQTKHR